MEKYKYFEKTLKYADFTDKHCEKCGNDKNCLDTLYFAYSSEDIESVCMNCLDEGKGLVKIPSYIYNRISSEVIKYLEGCTEEEAKEHINLIIRDLERTPPIPWVQNNDWQVCCGDFMTYVGELGRGDLDSIATDGDGEKLLLNLLDEDTKNRIDDLECLWDDLEDYAIAYQFKCMVCGKQRVIIQTF